MTNADNDTGLTQLTLREPLSTIVHDTRAGPHMDITQPALEVEVMIDHAASTLWVNVDGICRLRICRMGEGVFRLDDKRPVAKRRR